MLYLFPHLQLWYRQWVKHQSSPQMDFVPGALCGQTLAVTKVMRAWHVERGDGLTSVRNPES
jgi:hypothetical protein